MKSLILFIFFAGLMPGQALGGIGPATQEVIDFLEKFGPISRASSNEEGVRSYIRSLVDQANATGLGATFEQDSAGNVLVRVAGHGVAAEYGGIALHAHLDMVNIRTHGGLE